MDTSKETDFLPNLPSGPLDEYRKRVSFNWKNMKIIFEQPKNLKLKYDIWTKLENESLFQHPTVTLSTEEMKRLSAIRAKKFLTYNFLQRNNAEKMSYTNKTKQLMIVNEALVVVFPDVSIKLGLGYSLFTNALLSMGTERHQRVYKAAWNGQMSAGFAITEISHGSNTKLMKTRATYDPKTEEFVIHTPDFESAKCWVGNLGKTCTVLLLIAQLYTEDQCRGLHVFLVPVRDPKTLLPYPGIIVGDMGEKSGLHGIDNGFIIFDNYRIPRECLLNRTADVTPEGIYESSFTDPGKILGAALELLGAARVGVIQENTSIIALAVTIAVRYAAIRKQFGPRAGVEMAIIEYPLHQWRLFPYVAASCVIKLFTETFTEIYLGILDGSTTGKKIDNLSETISEIHVMVSAAKPSITFACRDAIQEAREACGGFGCLKAARLGELRCDQDPAVTYEGDNNVLPQQTSNWLLRQWSLKHVEGNEVMSPLGTCTFLNDGKRILQRKFTDTNPDNICNINFILESYKWLICWLCSETTQEIDNLMKNGACKFEARNHVVVYRSKIIPRLYFDHLAMQYYWDKIHKSTNDINMLKTLQKLGLLYGLWSLEKYTILFYEGQYATGPNLVKFINQSVLKLCSELKNDIIGVIDALAPPDFILNSLLGRADGKLYQNLKTEMFHKKGNLSRPSWWPEISQNTPHLNDILKSKM